MNRYLTAADGSTVYVTIDGDMVDDIANTYYGQHLGRTELIYANNPDLADLGPKLSAGVVIKLPQAPPASAPKPFRRLWD